MIENLSASDVANEISMMRSSFKGTFVVVEGVTDSRLYSKFTVDDAKVVVAFSKDNVKRSVNELRGRRNDTKVIGIVDPDLDRIGRRECRFPVFDTDRRDQETMVMCSHALEDVLYEYADMDALKSFEEVNGNVRDVIAKAVAPIGMLMYISERDDLGLSFKNLDYRSFIDRRTLKLNPRRMIEDVFSISRAPMIGKKDALQKLGAELKSLKDPWLVVRGHDAVAVLTMGISEIFGSYNGRGLKEGQVSGSLRLAFSFGYFSETNLYSCTYEWSASSGNPLWVSHPVPDF